MRHLCRSLPGFGLALTVTLLTGLAHRSAAQTSEADLTIATWGGFYQKAQTRVLAEPFAFQSAKTIDMVTYSGQPDEVRQLVEAYRSTGEDVGWDIIDLERADAEQLCFEGYIQPLQLESLGLGSANSASALGNDFVDGALGLCWVGNVVWSQSFGYDKRLYRGAEPLVLADAFNLTLFPGRRVLTTSAQVVLELALLSEGVPSDQVYDVLADPVGVVEAIAVLDRLRGNVTFTNSAADASNLLKTGQAGIGIIHHFEALREARAVGETLGYIWDGHVLDMDVFAIPVGAENPVLARDFIASVSRAAYQSAMATVTGYGPARLSAADAAREDLRVWLPTGPENRDQGLLFKPAFWQSPAGKRAQAAYDTWRTSIL